RARLICIRPLGIRMSQQALPDTRAILDETSDRANLIAAFAVLEMALGHARYPDWVAVEVTNHAPNLISGMLENCAVQNLRHLSFFLHPLGTPTREECEKPFVV